MISRKIKKIRIRNIKAFNGETYFKDPDSLKSLNYINFADVNEIYHEFHNKLIAVIDKNDNKNHGLQKVSLSPSKQKTFTTKSSWKQNQNSGMIDTNIIETLLTN